MLLADLLEKRNKLIYSDWLDNAMKLLGLISLAGWTISTSFQKGTDDWEYKFEPSQMKNKGLPPREFNNVRAEFDSSDDMKKKAVTFAAAMVNDRERRSRKSKTSRRKDMSRSSSGESNWWSE